jgi:low affinity Fe/Cu permease
MSGLYLGIKTQNPVVGITSANPGTANAMLAAQQMAQAQQDQQTAKQVDPRWSNLGPTVVHEMPWHKAHPGLKNVQ